MQRLCSKQQNKPDGRQNENSNHIHRWPSTWRSHSKRIQRIRPTVLPTRRGKGLRVQVSATRITKIAEPTNVEFWWWQTSVKRKCAGNTFNCTEWIEWWKNTGAWTNRGNRKNNVVMARIDYEQPFSADNVELLTRSEANRRSALFYKGKRI